MELSRRIASLSPSPTVALNAKAQAMARSGIKVVNLTVGEPDFPTPQAVVDCGIAALKAGKTKYGAAGGGPKFRQAVVDKLRRENDLSFNADQVVAGIGAKEILFHLAMAMLNEGDEVLIPAPYWVSYPAHCEAVGAIPVTVPMPADTRGAMVTPEMLEAAATPKTKAFILNSPNNPGGYILSENQLRDLGKYLLQKDWWIVSDEIYEYMAFDVAHVSLLKLYPELKDRFVLVNGLSKSFAMTGWRVGYCCGPKPLMTLVQTLQTQSSTCLPPFIEEAATFALDQGRVLAEGGVKLLRTRRDLVVAALAEIPGVGFIRPQGAFYAFIDVREILAQSTKFKDTLTFGQHLLETHHVAMVPGEAFGVQGFLRMSYATDNVTLEAGLERLKQAIASA